MILDKIYILKMVILLRIEIVIRQIREQKHISLEELSKKANISKAHLSYIERNEKEPSISVLVKIAKALNVRVADLYKVEW